MTEMDPKLIAESKATRADEILFDAEDLLFTRTDDRGIIRAGNKVFAQLSGLDQGNLLGSPHKIVRHPDMPRGVFYSMWKSLQSGEMFGGYIKNRSQDGRFYWVFALSRRHGDGYASVRLKPQSEYREKAAEIYAEMHQAETEGATPEDSAALMLRRLEDLGFPDYESFQAVALATECAARAKSIGGQLTGSEQRFRSMGDAILDVQKETVDMLEAFKAIRTVPLNMRILASRLENAGGPIGAISVNYGSMLDEMKEWVIGFSDPQRGALSRIRGAIVRGMLLSFAARLQDKAGQSFASQAEKGVVSDIMDLAEEGRILCEKANGLRDETAESLKVVELEAGRLSRSVLDMKRYVTGLSSTRMMCKIESATLSESGDALSGIVDQLDACQNEIEDRLARISELNGLIHSNTTQLRSLGGDTPD